MHPELLQELEQALTTEQTRLEGELASFATKDPNMKDDWDARFPKATGGGEAPDEEEREDVRESYEAELAGEHSLETRLRSVRQALDRIREGSYGTCKTCGQPIPEDRLRANPAAAYDITHEPKNGS